MKGKFGKVAKKSWKAQKWQSDVNAAQGRIGILPKLSAVSRRRSMNKP